VRNFKIVQHVLQFAHIDKSHATLKPLAISEAKASVPGASNKLGD